MTSTRRAKYLMKKRKHKSPSSVTSQLSTCNTNDSGIDEISEDLVCTNCVEADIHLSKICDELFGHPSIARNLIDGVANNPLFPKGDLDHSLSVVTGVPVTTSICLDCSYSDCDEPKKTKYHGLDASYTSAETRTLLSSLTSSFNKARKTHSYSHFHNHSNTRQTSSKYSHNSNGNYEKERREIERQLIRKIYDLVCVDQTLSTNSSTIDNCETNSSSSTSFITDQISKNTAPNANRITKLFVSELAIRRMENIQKLNYTNQLDRIKRKLLNSYMAFSKFDEFIAKSNSLTNSNSSRNEIVNIVPYVSKIKELERSLQTKY